MRPVKVATPRRWVQPAQGAGEPGWSTRRPAGRLSARVASALPVAGFAVVGAVLAATVVLRFWTRSDMWLDEALTLNLARLPLHQLPQALRHDGAPPLYYALLHYWTDLFGTSDLAVRSLSGLFGVASLPLAWLAGRRLGGRLVAWATTLVVATSPFAVRYSTENRMYALVMLLVLAGYLCLGSVLSRPRPANLAGLGLVAALLLYSHYWSIYLLAVTGLVLAWRARQSVPARWALAALGGGALVFVPWLPVFAYQAIHTGTPWAVPASFSAVVHAVAEFAGGDSSPARALLLVFFALAGLALFGRALDQRRIELDLRTRPPARVLALVTFGTLALAVALGYLAGSTFQGRYASVVFPLFALLVAYGLTTMADRRVRYGVMAVVIALGLATSASNVTTQRTQAGAVAAAIRATAHPGDVVGYCPDQLGPAVSRLLPSDLVQMTFPSRTSPRVVDWVDYASRMASGHPANYAAALLRAAGPARAVYLVWAPGYLTLNGKCEQVENALGAARPRSQELVRYDSTAYFEFDDLVRYPPQ
jgi:mannosyltransferase